MKRIFALLLTLVMLLALTACGKDKDPNKDGAATTTVQQAEVTDGAGTEETTLPEGETTTGDETVVTDENGQPVTKEVQFFGWELLDRVDDIKKAFNL